MSESQQLALWAEAPISENQGYLSDQLITYIGNKRALLGQIGYAVERVKRRLDKKQLRCLDVFSGSGVVSRLLKGHASFLASNDLEHYATVISKCYLANRSELDFPLLQQIVSDLNQRVLSEPLSPGFIEEMYAPRDEDNITKEDRVFYTKNNARRIDNYRRLIESAPADLTNYLLAPLLSEASIHANTAGVFKGFYKNKHTGIGQFGGSGSDALLRILGDIVLKVPVLSNFECEHKAFQADANTVSNLINDLDIAYIDPPYNQHPYGSNYFMLNLIAKYERPKSISRVSGIPKDWQRSGYNTRSESLSLMTELVERLDTRFLLISFNNEGFIEPAAMRAMLRKVGTIEEVETQYNAFRGSRSFQNRSIHVTEHLFLVERK